jgi:hypothetical protein
MAAVFAPIPFARFGDELLHEQTSGTARKKMGETLELLSLLKVKTTADLGSPELLDDVVDHLKGNVKSQSFIYATLWRIHAMCKRAKKMGSLEFFPFDARPELKRQMLDAARKQAPQSRLTDDQFKRAMAELAVLAEQDNLAHRAYVLCAICGYTGWIPAMVPEILVAGVDFTARTISVRRETGKKIAELTAPLHDDLALILDGWIAKRGHHAGRKLDEQKVAEARRLHHQEGWSIDKLALHFGTGRIAMYNAVTERTWKDGGASSISESERLCPNLNPGPKRSAGTHNKMTGRDLTSYNIVKAAGDAAGIDNLTPVDFSQYHRAKFARKRPDGGRNESVPVLIEPGPGRNVWRIMGHEAPALTHAPEIRGVNKLYNAWKKGDRVPLKELGDDRKALANLKARESIWSIIDPPGSEGNRGRGYGFNDPRLPI